MGADGSARSVETAVERAPRGTGEREANRVARRATPADERGSYVPNSEETSLDSAFRRCSAAVLGAQSMASATAAWSASRGTS